MDLRLEGRDVLITGAGRGLGKGIATGFARAGATVWLCSDDAGELEATTDELEAIGGRARRLTVDLSAPEGCVAVIDWVAAAGTGLRAVINNAAVLSISPVQDLPLEEWNRTLAVNLTAPFLIARGLVPQLSADGGSIINVSSMAGVRPTASEAAYCASKFGIEGMSRCMALDLAQRRISVNTITPGLRIKPTSLTTAQALALPKSERSAWNDPEALAPAFLFLAGPTGRPTGRRFDARTLTGALERWGPDETLARIDEVAVA
jgi:NAD(P)-dependent dehydrogenase (short-subunit alcohol dehydrogenase family)